MMSNDPLQFGFLRTSRTELRDIAKAWIIISLAFAFIFSGASLLGGGIGKVTSVQFVVIFGISLFTAGLGFLLHELAHKLVAQRYGCLAEFRAFDQMLYLALGLAVFVGFLFAAPGAVMIAGQVTRQENGKISVAGPLTNYILALIFLGVNFFIPAFSSFTRVGFSINLWLGLFNMIPVWNLDGKKIFLWSKAVWGAMVAVGIAGMVLL